MFRTTGEEILSRIQEGHKVYISVWEHQACLVMVMFLMHRPSYSNNQLYKKNHETFESKIENIFSLTEEWWVRRGGKGEGGSGKFFL